MTALKLLSPGNTALLFQISWRVEIVSCKDLKLFSLRLRPFSHDRFPQGWFERIILDRPTFKSKIAPQFMIALLPIFSRPCTRPMEVTVLPSPEATIAAQTLLEQITAEFGGDRGASLVEVFGQVELFGDGFSGREILLQDGLRHCVRPTTNHEGK
jgi:hypothetical protein